MNNKVVLHLSLIPGVTPAVIDRITKSMPDHLSLQDLYSFSVRDFGVWCSISSSVAEKIVAGLKDSNLVDREWYDCEKYQVQIVAITDPEYPALLKEISCPPPVLYVRGDATILNNKSFAVVGSRDADEYGEQAINQLVPAMVQQGYTIISGGALGADAMAHHVALEHGGKTVAIIGSGLLKAYPPENIPLFKEIVAAGGVVMSSFPLNAVSLPAHFPIRNRYISGMSSGCLVVQAAQKSGALITGRCALEQGRELFVVPGRIDNHLSAGCHTLIQEGAKLTTSAADILVELDAQYAAQYQKELQAIIFDAQKPQKKAKKSMELLVQQHQLQREEVLAGPQKIILQACQQPQSVDDLVEVTKLDFSEIMPILFELQVLGRIQQTFAGSWQRV